MKSNEAHDQSKVFSVILVLCLNDVRESEGLAPLINIEPR